VPARPAAVTAAARLVAATRRGIAVAEQAAAGRVDRTTLDEDVRSLAADPSRPGRVYAGTQGRGVFRSDDGGETWSPAGLQRRLVKALAVGPDGAVLAGTKPPAVFVSHDAGVNWHELESFRPLRRWYWWQPAEKPHTPYVQALAVSPAGEGTILAGIEAFRILRSADGGRTWMRLRRGVCLDCHDLAFHPVHGQHVYAGAGLGASWSRDGGLTWSRATVGLDRRYILSIAVDPHDPELWYAGAARMRTAHGVHSHACLFRWAAGRWEKLGGGLPAELEHLPTALTSPLPGIVYAGLRDGTVWGSSDRGDTWARVPVAFDGLRRLVVLL
jgi:photosystem II stability/assembly factor-like uncharacterized protein